MGGKKMLGEILVEKGLISEKILQRALVRQKRLKKKLGTILEEIDIITDEELAFALANQYGCKAVRDFVRYSFPPELLRIIPVDLAMEHFLFPLKIEGGRLAIATADPGETRMLDRIAANSGLSVTPFVATKKDIIAAISRHYLGKDVSQPQEKTVLVVEDNKLIFTMLNNVLSKEGYRVIVATDGMEGYKAAATEAPHVVITDMEMPKLNGYGLLDALRNLPETRETPVILLTGRTDPEEEGRALEKGFYDFIAKPIKEIVLLSRIKRAFQSIGVA